MVFLIHLLNRLLISIMIPIVYTTNISSNILKWPTQDLLFSLRIEFVYVDIPEHS